MLIIDRPVVTGAGAAIVETQVTKVLEDTLSGIEGIDYITSISRQESSQITVRFQLNRDPDYAAADVRDRVGAAAAAASANVSVASAALMGADR